MSDAAEFRANAKAADAVREAKARADAVIRPAMDLYAERNRLMPLIYRLPMRDLVRLNALIARLSEEELRMVAAFAEGLVEWGGADAPQAPNG